MTAVHASPRGRSALRDSRTMSRRAVRRLVRYPSLTIIVLAMPLVFLLLFVYVFGGTMGAGATGAAGPPSGDGADARADYLAYVVPGVLAMTLASVASSTAISVSMDMTAGIIARFKTMPIARVSILTGHVVGAMIQSVLGLAVLLGVAVLLGYRPEATAAGWVGALALMAIFAFALTWLAVLLGLSADSVETASNTPLILSLLPFIGSGFVPTDTMPAGLRWVAEHQPFTPVMEALRSFLTGEPAGSDGWIALAWCLVIGLAGYLGSRRLYDREPA
ncbi:ABC transporter permease [Janibacter alkaliphilus]|uniref:Transport permease protein n=1 Tax=Janibacter alkaliphilus TaxID=1069963 RepID=A0A852WZM0_9MICO|nr:ABC transporter permease [Janibacter alkaliphilus]NYG36482.1 ABC-2 type transport system permease protein [Janibacter alkaliphilus]